MYKITIVVIIVVRVVPALSFAVQIVRKETRGHKKKKKILHVQRLPKKKKIKINHILNSHVFLLVIFNLFISSNLCTFSYKGTTYVQNIVRERLQKINTHKFRL